jgi:hypothetical protein
MVSAKSASPMRMATSRPSDVARWSFQGVRCVPNTRAPRVFASWSAAVPTPLPTAWMSSVSPAARRICVVSASCAVMNASGTAAACTSESAAGMLTASSSWVTMYSA